MDFSKVQYVVDGEFGGDHRDNKLEFPRFDGRLWASRFQPFSGAPFVVDWRLIPQSRMAARGIVPAFDELEACDPRFGLGLELSAVQQFTFERCEETLAVWHG